MDVRIRQNGVVKCPICNRCIEWKYTMETFPTGDRLATAHDVVPYNAITYRITANSKIKFTIFCGDCRSPIETEEMNFLN